MKVFWTLLSKSAFGSYFRKCFKTFVHLKIFIFQVLKKKLKVLSIIAYQTYTKSLFVVNLENIFILKNIFEEKLYI